MASCSFELLTGFINITKDRFERVESIFIILVSCNLEILQLICKIRVFLRLALDRRKKWRGQVIGNLGFNYFFTEESPLNKKYSQREVSDNTSRRIFKSYLSLLTFRYMVEI